MRSSSTSQPAPGVSDGVAAAKQVHVDTERQLTAVSGWQSLSTPGVVHPPIPTGTDRASAAAAAVAAAWSAEDAGWMAARSARGEKLRGAGVGAAAGLNAQDAAGAAEVGSIEV